MHEFYRFISRIYAYVIANDINITLFWVYHFISHVIIICFNYCHRNVCVSVKVSVSVLVLPFCSTISIVAGFRMIVQALL